MSGLQKFVHKQMSTVIGVTDNEVTTFSDPYSMDLFNNPFELIIIEDLLKNYFLSVKKLLVEIFGIRLRVTLMKRSNVDLNLFIQQYGKLTHSP